ncbi:protein kinase domain-containing protein [Deinococcus radiodurans]|uniref:protein kinase domain-containing protein n=2 Tax=Deinococcus radiodurans TaxID=1299 RepID=UPI001FB6B5E5|nr:right-handed parallel beta-helix repeat-containing protein [Deinococcus radiodurans]
MSSQGEATRELPHLRLARSGGRDQLPGLRLAAGGNSQTLPPGTTLQGGKYRLEQVLGQGGFGITYLGSQTQLGARVAIKELFPSGSTRQSGQYVLPPAGTDPAGWAQAKQDFTAEGRTVARFNHPDIVRVMDLFEENGTAYLVMEFLEGQTLGSAIEKRGPLPPDEVVNIAKRVLGALSVVHSAGMLHRDIKPDNIYLDKAGRTVLIDFGSARTFAAGQTVSHTRLVTPGYAPLEQYSGSAKFGPYTDIYALGATLYHALTGHPPTPATDRTMGTPLAPLPPNTPPALREAIERSLAIKINERPQSTQEVLALLNQVSVAPQSAPAAPAPRPTPPQRNQTFPPAPQPTPQRQPQRPPQPVPQPPAQRRRGPGCGCLFPLLLLGGLALYGMNVLGPLLSPSQTETTTTSEQTQPEPPAQTPTTPTEDPTIPQAPGTTDSGQDWQSGDSIDLGLPGSNGETPAQTDNTATPETTTQGNAGTETNPTTTPETNTSTAPTSGELVVTAPNVTLRSAADAAANSLGTLAAGSTVQILQTQDGWYEVQTTSGQRGWVGTDAALPPVSAEALKALQTAAGQGGDVQLSPGVYRLQEPLVLSQDAHLTGAGRDRTWITSAAGNAVLTTRGNVSLQGVTVGWTGQTPGGALLAEGGTVTLRDARLTGGVRDETRNESGSGLQLSQGAQGDVQGSDLVGNAYGASVSDTAQLKLKDSTLSDNSLGGAIFLDSSGGEVRGSTLERNGGDGLTVRHTAAPVIVDSELRDNGERGLSVEGQAKPTVKRVTASGNTLQGIGVQDDAQPQLSNNKLTGNGQEGLTYADRAGGRASENELSGNQVGIAVQGSAAPELRTNIIRDSRDAGLSYAGQAGGTARGNTITGSAKPGISLWGEAQPTLSSNVIQGGAQSGIVFAEHAGGTLDSNEVLGNALSGLVVRDTAAPEVRGNTFQDNGKAAMVYEGEAGGRVSGNTCQGNGSDVIELHLTSVLAGPDLSGASCAVQTQGNW